MWNTIFNWGLLRFVPFNKPHRFWVNYLDDERVEVSIPYKKSNKNHINGIHACAFATASEYASGLLLLYNLDQRKYRLIMEKISVSYHYQGKTSVKVHFDLPQVEIQKLVFEPLKTQEKVSKTFVVNSYDESNNHLATAEVVWQIKSWKKVKTRV